MPNTSNFYQDSIFWVDVNKIKPNPFQPRHEFDEDSMRALADSIKQYGVLQALVVTRKEIIKDDGLGVEYELIAGERRLRASKIAGLSQVPVIIRVGEGDDNKDDLMKLELAIIENVQREDLNPVERARAFKKLTEQFGFKHHQIAQKIGKSRVYVSNTMRILDLPEEMLSAVSEGKINEGHTRPLLMLIDRPEEQRVLFQDIMLCTKTQHLITQRRNHGQQQHPQPKLFSKRGFLRNKHKHKDTYQDNQEHERGTTPLMHLRARLHIFNC